MKQFMLLSIVRQLPEQLTFTQLGDILGCSRQNIKKLADALEKKGFITIQQSSSDARAMCICPAKKAEEYFQEEFSVYQKELKYLFEVYTEKELEQFFPAFDEAVRRNRKSAEEHNRRGEGKIDENGSHLSFTDRFYETLCSVDSGGGKSGLF